MPDHPGRRRAGGLIGKLQEVAEDKLGYTAIPTHDRPSDAED